MQSLLKITFAFSLLGALLACNEGARKLERKPRTHVRKLEKKKSQLISVYRTESAMDRPYRLRSINVPAQAFNSEVLGGSVFELGMHFEDVSVALTVPVKGKKKGQVLVLLQQLSETMADLGIGNQKLDSLLTSGILPDHAFMQDLYKKCTLALHEKGGDKEAVLMQVGAWIEHLYLFLQAIPAKTPELQAYFIEHNRITGKNHLMALLELGGEEEVDGYVSDLNRIMRSLDRFGSSATPETVSMTEDGTYVIKGGMASVPSSEQLEQLKSIVTSIRNEK